MGQYIAGLPRSHVDPNTGRVQDVWALSAREKQRAEVSLATSFANTEPAFYHSTIPGLCQGKNISFIQCGVAIRILPEQLHRRSRPSPPTRSALARITANRMQFNVVDRNYVR